MNYQTKDILQLSEINNISLLSENKTIWETIEGEKYVHLLRVFFYDPNDKHPEDVLRQIVNEVYLEDDQNPPMAVDGTNTAPADECLVPMNLNQGVSLPFLERLKKELQKCTMLDKPLRQSVEAFIKPLTDRPNYTTLGDALAKVWTPQYLGTATTFVSFAEQNTLTGQLLEVATQYLADHETEQLWWYFVTCSQHARHWEALSTDDTVLFRRVIESLPKFVLVLSSWSKPLQLDRLWVLYELWCAVRTGREIIVLTSSKEDITPKDSETNIYKAIKDRVNIAHASCHYLDDERALRKAFAEDGEKQVEEAIVVALLDAYSCTC